MADHHAHAPDVSLAGLVADGLLDAELAALAWALACGGVGILVAGPDGTGPDGTGPGGASGARGPVVGPGDGSSLAAALADAVALTTRVVHLGAGSAAEPVEEAVGKAGGGVLVLTAPDLGGSGESALRRAAARAAVRAVSDRTGIALVATIRAADLEGVLGRLRGLTVAAPDDEIERLGVVMVLGASEDGRPRVVAAHYLRAPAVGPLGRVERRGPAVLATFDAGRGAWDHFGWGIVPELADRVAVSPADLEAAVTVRRETIEALVAHGLRGVAPFRAAANLALPAPRA